MVSVVAALMFALVQSAAPLSSVIFVCEHGAAKSVIATAYVNKLAAERGLHTGRRSAARHRRKIRPYAPWMD